MQRWRGLLLIVPFLAYGQATCPVRHLSIFGANVAEVLEERTLELQAGENAVEWRSLMPQAAIGTVRVTGEQLVVLRQDVTFDGADVGNVKSPVLHLLLRNPGAAGPRKVQVDYLAPKMSWTGEYSLVLDAPRPAVTPAGMLLDGWVSVRNETGMDVCADAVDLVAGDVELLADGGQTRGYAANAQMAPAPAVLESEVDSAAEPQVAGLSVFTRFGLGRNIAIAANTPIARFPLFQKLKLAVEQRDIFENDAQTQTLGRGGFMLQPRGLEVRLVSRNDSAALLPNGTVTIYSQDSGLAQVVGQDRIPITPVGSDFSVTQGRSNVLQGTRRVIDRREVPDAMARNHMKLVTKVEVVISNRGKDAATAFVREGVENWGYGEWTVIESSHPQHKLGDRMMEFRIQVPAKESVKVEYTVEVR